MTCRGSSAICALPCASSSGQSPVGAWICRPRQRPGRPANVSDEDPCGGRARGGFEALCRTRASGGPRGPANRAQRLRAMAADCCHLGAACREADIPSGGGGWGPDVDLQPLCGPSCGYGREISRSRTRQTRCRSNGDPGVHRCGPQLDIGKGAAGGHGVRRGLGSCDAALAKPEESGLLGFGRAFCLSECTRHLGASGRRPFQICPGGVLPNRRG